MSRSLTRDDKIQGRGQTDKAPDYGSGDCRFDSYRPHHIMLKQYEVISGLYGIFEGAEVDIVEFEYQDVMLDLAQAVSVCPHTYCGAISNWKEHNKRRDDEWHKKNPHPEPWIHPPSMMTTSVQAMLPCMTIQVGTQSFYFDKDQDAMFYLVSKELSES